MGRCAVIKAGSRVRMDPWLSVGAWHGSVSGAYQQCQVHSLLQGPAASHALCSRPRANQTAVAWSGGLRNRGVALVGDAIHASQGEVPRGYAQRTPSG